MEKRKCMTLIICDHKTETEKDDSLTRSTNDPADIDESLAVLLTYDILTIQLIWMSHSLSY